MSHVLFYVYIYIWYIYIYNYTYIYIYIYMYMCHWLIANIFLQAFNKTLTSVWIPLRVWIRKAFWGSGIHYSDVGLIEPSWCYISRSLCWMSDSITLPLLLGPISAIYVCFLSQPRIRTNQLCNLAAEWCPDLLWQPAWRQQNSHLLLSPIADCLMPIPYCLSWAALSPIGYCHLPIDYRFVLLA